MKKETKTLIRRMGILLFIVYVLLLIYFLFFSEEYGRTARADQAFRYNLVPFLEIRRFWMYREQLGLGTLCINLLGNILGFVPFGCILPVISDQMRNGFVVTLGGFCFSLTAEVIQLVTKAGCFDVDDLILNTFGAALGYVLFVICNHIRRKYNGKKI